MYICLHKDFMHLAISQGADLSFIWQNITLTMLSANGLVIMILKIFVNNEEVLLNYKARIFTKIRILIISHHSFSYISI